jgi:hypothetical protein
VKNVILALAFLLIGANAHAEQTNSRILVIVDHSTDYGSLLITNPFFTRHLSYLNSTIKNIISVFDCSTSDLELESVDTDLDRSIFVATPTCQSTKIRVIVNSRLDGRTAAADLVGTISVLQANGDGSFTSLIEQKLYND